MALVMSISAFDPERTFGRHTPQRSGKILELPICSHAGPGGDSTVLDLGEEFDSPGQRHVHYCVGLTAVDIIP
jgi:hypothetical protein